MITTASAARIGTSVFVLILMCASQESVGQSVRVRNGMGQPVYLWVWQDAQSGVRRGWHKPVFITPSRPVSVHLTGQDQYHVVVRDEAGNDDPIGMVKFGEILRMQPKAAFVVVGDYKTVMESENVNVMKHVIEKRTRREYVWDGSSWWPRDIEYHVRVPVPETKTRQVNKTVFEADLMVEYDGKLVPLDHFEDRSRTEASAPPPPAPEPATQP